MKIPALMAISLALIGGGAIAQEVSLRKSAPTKISDKAVVYGIGASSCGAWLDAREGAKKNKNDVRHIQCVFRGKSSTHSNRKHPLIPIEVIQ